MRTELRVIKCCTTDDGRYLGDWLIHDNVTRHDDGPWYTQVWQDDEIITDDGYGCKSCALKALDALLRTYQVRPKVIIDPWD